MDYPPLQIKFLQFSLLHTYLLEPLRVFANLDKLSGCWHYQLRFWLKSGECCEVKIYIPSYMEKWINDRLLHRLRGSVWMYTHRSYALELLYQTLGHGDGSSARAVDFLVPRPHRAGMPCGHWLLIHLAKLESIPLLHLYCLFTSFALHYFHVARNTLCIWNTKSSLIIFYVERKQTDECARSVPNAGGEWILLPNWK